MPQNINAYWPHLLAPHPDEPTADLWFQEEARAERQTNLIRIAYALAWLAATGPGILLPQPNGSWVNIIFGTINLGTAVAYQLYLSQHPYRRYFKYIWITFDAVLVGTTLFLYHFDMGYSTSLKAPVYNNLMMVLLLAAFRFDRKFPIYGTAAVVTVYLSVLGYMVATQAVQFGSPLELFTTPKINVVYQIYRVSYLIVLGIFVVMLVNNVHRLVGLREKETEKAVLERARREQTQNLLERYFTPEITRYLIDHPPDMGGQMQRVTIVMTDLRGFTSLSEALGPAQTVTMLNELFAQLTSIVFKHKGMVDKFTGDGMLLVFGTPTPQPDDTLRAVRAALEMQTAVQTIGQKRQLDLELGVAIHTGDVIFGNIGSPQRMELTVIGDAVNTTARIEGLNKQFGTTIIISEPAYRQVADHIEVETLPETTLRGKRTAVGLYSVCAEI